MGNKVIILGAGPTGLGAAHRLNELGHQDWEVYEKNDYCGGLSASFKDEKGFWWDFGGHIMFSHYPYYDAVIESVLKEEYLSHLRESWIWIMQRFIPYPFQNNIHRLPEKEMNECLHDLIEASSLKKDSNNFEEWVYATFGKGIAKYFMIPYNWKVWAHPPNKMAKEWISERVSVIDVEKIKKNIAEQKDDISWGPNNKFKFPLHGGTGELFRRIAKPFEKRINYHKELKTININKKFLEFSDGSKTNYDFLISTIPVNTLVQKSEVRSFDEKIKDLQYSGGLIIGVGLQKNCPSTKCWMYFPEDDNPFYRVTYFSNYSPHNVPKGCYSLMAEVSYSDYKKEDKQKIIDQTIQGMVNTKLISKEDTKKIISTYLLNEKYSYPTPTLGRDKALNAIQPFLMENKIYSRGRFGAWKYEIGNMDHSFMQGVEAVDKIISNKQETTWTLD